ncbi:MAG TPA: hypothetical protein VGM77_11145 [Gemmatimonadales bacterium]|jgi:hypothetical protein
MAHFDIDAWQQTTERPSITLRGRTYTGKLLSAEQFLPILARLQSVATDPEGFFAVTRDYLTLIYPRQKWLTWRPQIVDEIMSQPNAAEIISSFFAIQLAAMSMTPTDQLTNGKPLEPSSDN